MSTVSASMADAKGYTQWIFDEFTPYVGQRVMEVGLACTNYLPFLKQAEDYLGVDVDPEVVMDCTRRYPSVSYMALDISDPKFADKIGDRRFDTILCVNVLEHIENDSAAVRNLLSVLEAGGHLLLFVPAFQFLFTKLDRLAGHVRRYTRSTLRQILPPSGMSVARMEYFNPVGALGWWAQHFVWHHSLESKSVSSQVQMFDKYFLPISRWFNGVTKLWFGQSLICVIRKQ